MKINYPYLVKTFLLDRLSEKLQNCEVDNLVKNRRISKWQY